MMKRGYRQRVCDHSSSEAFNTGYNLNGTIYGLLLHYATLTSQSEWVVIIKSTDQHVQPALRYILLLYVLYNMI